MRDFDSNRSAGRAPRNRLLIGALAILVLGSVTFAAGGGMAMVKSWIVRCTLVGSNGEVIETTLELVPDEEGIATVVLPMPADANEVTVTIAGTASGEGEEAGDLKTVNVVLEGSTAGIQLEPGEGMGLKRKQRQESPDDED